MADSFAWLIPLAPLVAAILAAGISFAGIRRGGHYLVVAAILIATLVTAGLVLSAPGGETRIAPGYRWLSAGSFVVDIALRIDPLTLTLLPIGTGVSLIVAIYAVGYMTTDRGFTR